MLAPFPLTPALSLRERGPQGTRVTGTARAARCPTRTAILPLPAGEGRGEGERHRASQTAAPQTESSLRRLPRKRKVIAIESVSYVAPYRLQLRFDDGKENLVDFGPFLTASAHPTIRAYLDKARFKQFTVEDGFLHWNDFELVFPMADLYAGHIG